MIEINLQSVAYNIFFSFMFVLWLIRNHPKVRLSDRLRNGSLRSIWIFTLIYVPIMSWAVIFLFHSDVSLAITSAIQDGFFKGVNVYDPLLPESQLVVQHLLQDGTVIKGVYHYFPPDLFIHSIFFLFLGWTNSLISIIYNFWFLLTNLFLLTLLYPLVSKIVNLDHKRLVPMYFVFNCHFIMTNSTLMLVFFVIGYYFLQNQKKTLGYTGYILAASVKYTTGLNLVIHLIEDLQLTIKDRHFSRFIPYVIGSIILAITMIPFGFLKVLESTLLYQGEISRREGLATIQGPLLVEIMIHLNILDLYNIFFLLFGGIALVFSFWRGKNTYERILLLQFIMMFLLPFMATELFIVTIYHWFFTMILQNESIDPLLPLQE